MQEEVKTKPTIDSLYAEVRLLRDALYYERAKLATLTDAFFELRHAVCLAAYMLAMPGSDAANLTGFTETGYGSHNHAMLTPETRRANADLARLDPTLGGLVSWGPAEDVPAGGGSNKEHPLYPQEASHAS